LTSRMGYRLSYNGKLFPSVHKVSKEG